MQSKCLFLLQSNNPTYQLTNLVFLFSEIDERGVLGTEGCLNVIKFEHDDIKMTAAAADMSLPQCFYHSISSVTHTTTSGIDANIHNKQDRSKNNDRCPKCVESVTATSCCCA